MIKNGYSEQINIKYSEIDQNQALKPYSLLNYLQDIASKNAEDNGFGYSYIHPRNYAWFLIKYRMEFDEYGDINYILSQWNIYNDMCSIINKFKEGKQLKKSECIDLGLDTKKIEKFCNKITDKIFKEINNEALCDYLINNLDVYKMLINRVSKNYPYEPITKLETIVYEICYNGYTELIDETAKNNWYIVTEIETNQYGTIFCTLYHIKTGQILKLKINKYSYNEHPCNIGDIIKTFINIQSKTRLINDEWVTLDEKEEILKNYSIIKKFE